MAKKPAQPEAPEPAVMAAGASLENAAEGKGSSPPDAESETAAKAAEGSDKSGVESDAGKAAAERGGNAGEGSRDEQGRFTGNPPSDSERIDAICDLLERNGMSLPKVLRRPKE